MTKQTLLDHFSALEDPRQAWKVIYPLPEILLIVLCGTMAGAEDFCEIERWARQKLGFLRRLQEEIVWIGGLPLDSLQGGAAYAIAPDHLGAPHHRS